MTLGPGDRGPSAAGRGYLRASDADREQMIDTLKAVYAAGRLAKDDFDARIGQALAARTYAELAAVTAGLPAGPVAGPPPARGRSRRVSNAARWGASGLVTPAILAIAFALNSLPRNDRALGPVAFVITFVYFVFWLFGGLWYSKIGNVQIYYWLGWATLLAYLPLYWYRVYVEDNRPPAVESRRKPA